MTLKATLAEILASTSTSVSAISESDDQGVYALLSASVYEGSTAVNGLPVTFTITDGTTGQDAGTFAGTSNGLASCTIRYSLDETAETQTWSGDAVAPYAACALTSVTLPAADVPEITASYGGEFDARSFI